MDAIERACVRPEGVAKREVFRFPECRRPIDRLAGDAPCNDVVIECPKRGDGLSLWDFPENLLADRVPNLELLEEIQRHRAPRGFKVTRHCLAA